MSAAVDVAVAVEPGIVLFVPASAGGASGHQVSAHIVSVFDVSVPVSAAATAADSV